MIIIKVISSVEVGVLFLLPRVGTSPARYLATMNRIYICVDSDTVILTTVKLAGSHGSHIR